MSKKPKRSPLKIVRIGRAHLRLFAAIAVGMVSFLLLPGTLLPGGWTLWTRLLVAWDVGLLYYLTTTATMMASSTYTNIQQHSEDQDEGAFALMVLTIAAAAASFGAIFAVLAEAKGAPQAGAWPHLLAISTIVLSWTFTHTIFALHYAYDYYGEGARNSGLNFPETKNPDYWDFVYFAFVLGMTFQVSDVAITNPWIRRTATVHGVLSFFFNTTVIALTVNMAANAF